MALFLTHRFAPTYQAPQCNPFSFCAPVSRPAYANRIARSRPRCPQYSSFNHFFGQVDELLSEIDREAQRQAQLEAHIESQREAYRQREHRKRALRAKFTVNQTEQGWQIDGEFKGFDEGNISIEVTDGHTLKVAGSTELRAEKQAQTEQRSEIEAAPATEQQETERTLEDKVDDVAPDGPEKVTEAGSINTGATTPDSDTESHKSYQATVEDDFEDLGAETSSLVSVHSRPSSPTEVRELKGTENATKEHIATQVVVARPSQPGAPVQQQRQELQPDERLHGSFERTFRFAERIDAVSVSASFKDGALRITVPKAQIQQVRRIVIL